MCPFSLLFSSNPELFCADSLAHIDYYTGEPLALLANTICMTCNFPNIFSKHNSAHNDAHITKLESIEKKNVHCDGHRPIARQIADNKINTPCPHLPYRRMCSNSDTLRAQFMATIRIDRVGGMGPMQTLLSHHNTFGKLSKHTLNFIYEALATCLL